MWYNCFFEIFVVAYFLWLPYWFVSWFPSLFVALKFFESFNRYKLNFKIKNFISKFIKIKKSKFSTGNYFFVEFDLWHWLVAAHVAKVFEEQEADLLVENLVERVLADLLQVLVHHRANAAVGQHDLSIYIWKSLKKTQNKWESTYIDRSHGLGPRMFFQLSKSTFPIIFLYSSSRETAVFDW